MKRNAAAGTGRAPPRSVSGPSAGGIAGRVYRLLSTRAS